MENELQDRLQKFHQEILEVVIMNNDFPFSIDKETAEDIAEFFNTFLYD